MKSSKPIIVMIVGLFVLSSCGGVSSSATTPRTLTWSETYEIQFSSDDMDAYHVVKKGDVIYVQYQQHAGSYSDGEDYILLIDAYEEEEDFRIFSYLGVGIGSADANGWYEYTNPGEKSTKQFFVFQYRSQLSRGVTALEAAELADDPIEEVERTILSFTTTCYTITYPSSEETYCLEEGSNLLFESSLGENLVHRTNEYSLNTTSITFPHGLPVGVTTE